MSHSTNNVASTTAVVLFVATTVGWQTLQYLFYDTPNEEKDRRVPRGRHEWEEDRRRRHPRPLQQQRHRRSKTAPADLEHGQSPDQPKNRNWAHFDLSQWSQEQGPPAPPLHTKEEPNENSSESSLAESSSSSDEDFLWTDSKQRQHGSLHHHHHSYRRKVSFGPVQHAEPPPPSSDSPHVTVRWTRAIRKSVESMISFESQGGDSLEHEDNLFGPMEGAPYAGDEADALIYNVKNSLPPPRRWGSFRRYDDDDACNNTEIQRHNRTARAHYNAQIMPHKVIMMRHGQSMGNINERLYSTTPDNAMPLTKLGWEEARKSGQVLKEKVLASGESVHFIVSPYVRTVETFHGIVSAWCDPAEFKHIQDRDERLKAWYGRLLELGLTWHEDPRIREQDFGNYQDPDTIKHHKRERHRFGVFFYRFPHGESASDVFDRVSTFLDSLWRSFDLNQSRNYVLVTHGIAIRVLLARYFRYSIEQFSMLSNPKNCEMVILAHDGAGRLQLEGRCEIEHSVSEESGEQTVVGHSFHERLRVLPEEWVQKVKIRISYDD